MLLVSRFAFEPLVINEPFVVEIHFTNKSANKTIHGVQWNSSDIEPATDDLKLIKAHCETVFKSAKDYASNRTPKTILEIPPQAAMHGNVTGVVITNQKLLDALTAGKNSIYFAGYLDYTINGVRHKTPFLWIHGSKAQCCVLLRSQ
jgi:hypothetical protein